MQEHEFIHEHEYDGEQTHEYRCELAHEKTPGEAEKIATLVEIDEVQTRHATFWKCRLLVLAFYTNFLACLAALWFSGTLLSAPDGLLSPMFLQFMADHRLLALSVPVAILVVCYLGLRHLTGEIMTVPERYLDERQKMLRDQAHRSAFKLVKLACLLIPCGFLLPHLPWFNHSTPVVTHVPLASVQGLEYITVTDVSHWTTVYTEPGAILYRLKGPGVSLHIMPNTAPIAQAIYPTFAPASTTEIAIAGGLLLLCLLLVASALPMTTLAWKGTM